MQTKYLAYFTVGYNRVYIDVLNIAIKSLVYFTPNVDILVICDNSMELECKNKLPQNVIIITVPDSTQAAYASINKLKIFNVYPEVMKYHSVFFIDSDIITHTDIIPYFEKVIKTDTLYVYTEDTDPLANLQCWFSFNNYTQTDIERLRTQNIHPFNAGCFGFCPNDIMKQHFDVILEFIKNYKGSLHIYEQSFMNVYFNKINNTDRTLLTKNTYIMFPYRDYPIQSHEGKLIHFTGIVGSGSIKYTEIKKYTDTYMPFLHIE